MHEGRPASTESVTAPIQLVPHPLPDEMLLTRIRDPDEAIARSAFSSLFTTSWLPLCEWAYYFLRDQAAAEELVAEVLSNVWRRRHVWDPRGGIETYLFGAVRTQIRHHLRNTSRQIALTETFVAPGQSPGMGMMEDTPDAGVLHDELRLRLDRAMAELSGRARAAIMYRWYDGLEYDEIARRLGTTALAVRLLVTRAFKTLRLRLTQEE